MSTRVLLGTFLVLLSTLEYPWVRLGTLASLGVLLGTQGNYQKNLEMSGNGQKMSGCYPDCLEMFKKCQEIFRIRSGNGQEISGNGQEHVRKCQEMVRKCQKWSEIIRILSKIDNNKKEEEKRETYIL